MCFIHYRRNCAGSTIHLKVKFLDSVRMWCEKDDAWVPERAESNKEAAVEKMDLGNREGKKRKWQRHLMENDAILERRTSMYLTLCSDFRLVTFYSAG